MLGETVLLCMQEESLKEAMYRGPSASSLANSASSTETLLAFGANPASASAPDLASTGQALGPQYRWGLGCD